MIASTGSWPISEKDLFYKICLTCYFLQSCLQTLEKLKANHYWDFLVQTLAETQSVSVCQRTKQTSCEEPQSFGLREYQIPTFKSLRMYITANVPVLWLTILQKETEQEDNAYKTQY